MGTPRPETKFFFCFSWGWGRPHRCHRFSKLEKASLKFISWAPTVQNWMGMDGWTGKDEAI